MNLLAVCDLLDAARPAPSAAPSRSAERRTVPV